MFAVVHAINVAVGVGVRVGVVGHSAVAAARAASLPRLVQTVRGALPLSH